MGAGRGRGRELGEITPEVSAELLARSADGRHARRDRNRQAVLEAALALFREGDPRPRPEAIAARAGLSPRSLYRYFPDATALYVEAMDHNLAAVIPLAVIEGVGEGPLGDRIERCVRARLAFYEGLAPMVAVARATAAHDEVVRVRYASGRELLRAQVERHFATELEALPPAEREATAAAADVLCQLDTLHYLRRERGLPAGEVHRALVAGLTAVLTPRG